MNLPPLPRASCNAACASTLPAPCTNGSLPRSFADDIRILLTLNGSAVSPLSRRSDMTSAAAPAAIGDAMLVPPNSANAPSLLGSLLLDSKTLTLTEVGVKPYEPTAISSGLGSPKRPGPLLENSATSSNDAADEPKRVMLANALYCRCTLLLVAPTAMLNGDTLGVPTLPYPSPLFPALFIIIVPG